MMMLQDYQNVAPNLPLLLEISSQEVAELQTYLDCRLRPTWDWLVSVMDATEAQLRFGSVLSGPHQPNQKNIHASSTRQPAANTSSFSSSRFEKTIFSDASSWHGCISNL